MGITEHNNFSEPIGERASNLCKVVMWIDPHESYVRVSGSKNLLLLTIPRDYGAELLVTGNEDLLALEQFKKGVILSPRALIEH